MFSKEEKSHKEIPTRCAILFVLWYLASMSSFSFRQLCTPMARKFRSSSTVPAMTAMPEKKGAGLPQKVLRVCMFVLVVGMLIYRPLPAQLTTISSDRVTMHFLEPFARLVYYYPTRLCPTADCMLKWTRWSTGLLSWVVGPKSDRDSPLLMETTVWDGVKVRVYHPRDESKANSDGAIIFMHGGGFALGSIEMFESLTRTLAEQVNTDLFVSIDYRLAPGTVFPGQLEDCEKVLDYVIKYGPAEYGIDPRKIIVMGDSAGGNLAAAVAQRRRASAAYPRILGQALLYPLLQFSDLQIYSYRYWKSEMEGLAFLDPLTVAFDYLWYAGIDVNAHPEYAYVAVDNGHVSMEAEKVRNQYVDLSVLPAMFRDGVNTSEPSQRTETIKELADQMTPFLTNPDFAPLMQPDLSNLPSALVMTCQFDVLRDEGAIYAKRLQQAGVPTKWIHYEHGFHAMLNTHHSLEIARDAVADISNWATKLLQEA